MAELVPEDGFPVGGVAAARGGAVHGDHDPEAHAEKPGAARQTEGADGEVFLRGTVRSWAELRDAERAAWSAPGVRGVVNRLAVVL